jgi:hypothetical protein
MGDAFVPLLDGQFSFVLSDEKTGKFLVARDHIGTIEEEEAKKKEEQEEAEEDR